MLLIQILLDDEVIAEADNIQLEYYSTSTLRKFYFTGLQPKIDNVLLEIDDVLWVEIHYFSGNKNDFHYSDSIELELYEINHSSSDLWILTGMLTNYYSQGIIDVYNYWKSGKELQWYNLPKDISIIDYISSCLKFSSIQEITPKQDRFELDFSRIKSELEISCAFAEEFLGKRSYMGRYLDTFNDCLLTLYHHHGYFEDKTIVLKYKNLSIDEELQALIVELKSILNTYKFQVVEV